MFHGYIRCRALNYFLVFAHYLGWILSSMTSIQLFAYYVFKVEFGYESWLDRGHYFPLLIMGFHNTLQTRYLIDPHIQSRRSDRATFVQALGYVPLFCISPYHMHIICMPLE